MRHRLDSCGSRGACCKHLPAFGADLHHACVDCTYFVLCCLPYPALRDCYALLPSNLHFIGQKSLQGLFIRMFPCLLSLCFIKLSMLVLTNPPVLSWLGCLLVHSSPSISSATFEEEAAIYCLAHASVVMFHMQLTPCTLIMRICCVASSPPSSSLELIPCSCSF